MSTGRSETSTALLSGIRFREVLSILLVDSVVVIHITDINGRRDDIVQRRANRLENGGDVPEGSFSLVSDVAIDNLPDSGSIGP